MQIERSPDRISKARSLILRADGHRGSVIVDFHVAVYVRAADLARRGAGSEIVNLQVTADCSGRAEGGAGIAENLYIASDGRVAQFEAAALHEDVSGDAAGKEHAFLSGEHGNIALEDLVINAVASGAGGRQIVE